MIIIISKAFLEQLKEMFNFFNFESGTMAASFSRIVLATEKVDIAILQGCILICVPKHLLLYTSKMNAQNLRMRLFLAPLQCKKIIS